MIQLLFLDFAIELHNSCIRAHRVIYHSPTIQDREHWEQLIMQAGVTRQELEDVHEEIMKEQLKELKEEGRERNIIISVLSRLIDAGILLQRQFSFRIILR